MIDLHKLAEYLSVFKELTMEDVKFFFTFTRQRHFLPGDKFVAPGEMQKKVAHIKHGLMRAYMVTEDGEEITLFFRKEDQQIAPYDCIFANTPSRMYIEAMEKTTVYEIDHEKLQAFLDRHPRFEKVRRHFHQKLLMETFKRMETFILLPPQQRYLTFVRDNPSLVQRVPDKYIASVLGITPGSLSRIRKRIKERRIT